MRNLTDLYKQPGFWNVQDRKRVLPFPGKFPTRWDIQIYDGITAAKPRFHLVTKPDRAIISRVLREARRYGQINLLEFDKAGAFRQAWHTLPRDTFRVTAACASTCRFYYPWNTTTDFFAPWYEPVWSKQIRLLKHSFFIYSPSKELGGEEWLLRLREHRTWLRKSGLIGKDWKCKDRKQGFDLNGLPRAPQTRIELNCSQCGHNFTKPKDWAGRVVRCPNCQLFMMIPF